MSDNLEPKLNLLNLAGGLSQIVDLANKITNPATLAQLEADGKLVAADVQALMAALDKASADFQKALVDVQAALGVK